MNNNWFGYLYNESLKTANKPIVKIFSFKNTFTVNRRQHQVFGRFSRQAYIRIEP